MPLHLLRILELRLTVDTLGIVAIDAVAAFFYSVLLSLERQVIDTMSRASKVTLAATTMAAAGIIYFVHWAQEEDRAVSQVSPYCLRTVTSQLSSS